MAGQSPQLKGQESVASDIPEIWVVEDERLMRRVVKRILQMMNEQFKLVLFDDGYPAFEELMNRKVSGAKAPNIVLCDVNMPMMTGFELREYILREFPHILLLMMTALETNIPQLKAEGQEVLSKPFTADQLKDAIRELLMKALATEEEAATEMISVVSPEGTEDEQTTALMTDQVWRAEETRAEIEAETVKVA